MPKIVRFHQAGSAGVLRIEELPQQQPKDNEVRLRVQAIGLNRAEIMFRTGEYLETPVFPARLGLEAAGIVDAVGAGVTNFKIGERVSTVPSFSMSSYGVYGEEAIVPAHAVARYPSNLSPVEGASIWMQYLTVWGARPIAVTRTSAKKQVLLDLCASHVIAGAEEDLAAMVSKHTDGKGAELIFDPVDGPFLETLAQCAAPSAQIIEYGWLSGASTPFPLFPAFQKALTVRGYSLYEFVHDSALRPKAEKFVNEHLAKGRLHPKIDRTFTLAQVVEAHRHLQSNQQIGKVVVTVGD